METSIYIHNIMGLGFRAANTAQKMPAWGRANQSMLKGFKV